jgi:hypothetical protein
MLFSEENNILKELCNNMLTSLSMTTKRKEHLCRDIINSLPPLERNLNQIWTLGIALTGCFLEVCDSKELVAWCIDKFDKNQRQIQLQGDSLISLAPLVFKRILKLLELTITFKGDEAKDFMKAKNGELELLHEYPEDPTMVLEDLLSIQVSSLKNTYRE